MPGRNIVKYYETETYYHIYNRGVNLRKIFKDKEDYAYFEYLLERTVGPKQLQDKQGRSATWLRGQVVLNAYCLLGNHFHLLAYQPEALGVSNLMRTLGTAYTSYFNRKYKRRGPLFENVFRAVPITDDGQLMHITRYIHLNHHNYKKWTHSSYLDYLGVPRVWLEVTPIIELFESKNEYREFVQNYEAMQRELEEIKRELADNI